MIQSSSEISDIFFDCLDTLSENPWLYATQENCFQRKRKISFSDAILSTICMQKSSSKSEVLKFFAYQEDAPSHSALIQQRSKLDPSAFEDLFHWFTDSLSPDLTHKGYRLFAVDGSCIYIPRNKKDAETYRVSDVYGKGFNMLHLCVVYDLLAHLYTDVTIQPLNHINEYRALCDMVDRFAQLHPDEKALFIADRGFVSFNVFAHVIENNTFFLIRGREAGPGSLLSTISLPDSPEYDITFERWLTRQHKHTIKTQPEVYKSIADRVFDYLEPKSKELYYICFRIIKLVLPNGTTEYLYTNLPKEDFTLEEIRELYNQRWGVETSFRDIKYSAGMLFFHSRKKQLVLQEIYAKLILFNFCEAIAGRTIVHKKGRKYAYKVNFSAAVSVCVEYLRQCKQGSPLIKLDVMITRELIPIRPGRSSPRHIKARTAASFLYR